MKYLKVEDGLKEAECSNDAIQSSELLEVKLAELDKELAEMGEGADPSRRAKCLNDSAYILLDLVDRKGEAWERARQAFDLAIDARNWAQAVEACDVMAQSDHEGSVKAIAHGIWLGVTYPVDPELSVAMLQHLVDETPDNSDGAAVAAAVARYIVDLRAEDKQREDLQFFTNQMLGNVARRHTNGACDTQELFEIWSARLELDDPATLMPRLGQVIEVIAEGDWWIDRDALRDELPQDSVSHG